jgi:hypothetical protein
MILVAHIITACLSLLVSSVALLAPSRVKLYLSYAGILGTFGSGIALIATTNASLVHACITGTLFTLASALMTAAAHKKFAYQRRSIY